MISHMHTQNRLTIYLEEGETFPWMTPTGLISVSMIFFFEHARENQAVKFRGWVIKKDGSRGSIQRETRTNLRNVPYDVLLYAIATVRNIKLEERKHALEGS